MKVTPLADYILIKVDEETTKTDSGILIQTGAVRLPQTGTVEAVGEYVKSVKAGDHVLFLRYAAIDGPDKDTRLCKESHIIGTVDG